MHFYIIFLWKEIKSCAANVSSVSVFIVDKCCQVVSTSNVINSNLMVISACKVQRNSSLDVLMSNLNTFLQSITKRKYIPAKMPSCGIPCLWIYGNRKTSQKDKRNLEMKRDDLQPYDDVYGGSMKKALRVKYQKYL